MSRTFTRIIIDARPTDESGPFAEKLLLGQSILHRHIEAANRLNCPSPHIVFGSSSEPQQPGTKANQSSEFLLRTDRLYDQKRLIRAYRNGGDPESAVVWRLDLIGDLTRAASELERRLSYQPLGRYWAWPIAQQFAKLLRPTIIRPNTLTVSAAVSMLAASVCVVAGSGWTAQIATASLLALGLVLDTADGHLARIQGTASEFGRWLDAVLDELCDLCLHGAIAWSMWAGSGQPLWLAIGMAYMTSKYLFQTAMLEDRISNQPLVASERTGSAHPQLSRFKKTLRQVVHILGHADIRWHSWIILAAVKRLDLVLIFGVVYFLSRVSAMVVRKGLARG